MKIDAHITDVKTGETALYRDDYDNTGSDMFSAEECIEYMWSEGNYACDCNRELFFAAAKGLPEPDYRCGDGRFAVRVVERGTDRVIYEDGDA